MTKIITGESMEAYAARVMGERQRSVREAAMKLKGADRVRVYLAGVGAGKFRTASLAKFLKVSESTVRKVAKEVAFKDGQYWFFWMGGHHE